jgi:dolichyl-phosphate-mannose-protein mannosyltransferase
VIPIAVYVAAFAIHFDLVRRSGVNDAMMSARFRATLIGSPTYNPSARMSLLEKLTDVHGAMNRGNHLLEFVTHPAASRWYTWPIMKHPILMWQNVAAQTSSIILLGNPVVWWGSGLAVLVAAGVFARQRWRARGYEFPLLFLLGGFLLNYVPFMGIRRVMYLYHYLFALIWLIALAVMAIGVIAGWNEDGDDVLWHFPTRRSAALYWAIAGVVLVGFAYFSPFTFGWPLSQTSYDARFWVLHPQL